jgi:hypothetical protein
MLELLHAVITSLLLSAAMGGGVDKVAEAEEDPASPETGVDVGKMPSYLVSPRGVASDDRADDHQPASLQEQIAFCEPAVWVEKPIDLIQSLPRAVAFHTAGRSP